LRHFALPVAAGCAEPSSPATPVDASAPEADADVDATQGGGSPEGGSSEAGGAADATIDATSGKRSAA